MGCEYSDLATSEHGRHDIEKKRAKERREQKEKTERREKENKINLEKILK
jgi:hypothetical protein